MASMALIFLLWVLNLGISAFNAWSCDKAWNETKHVGGVAHLMNWAGAIMSAAGFTWCYMLVLGLLGATIPFVEQDDGTMATLFTPQDLSVFFDLGYLVVIGPILGSGLAITLNSWGYFWRKRTLGSGGLAGYNTFAQVYNTYNAIQYVPSAGTNVWKAFTDGNDKKNAIIGVMVLIAVAGGILTTYLIITRTAKSTAYNRGMYYDNQKEVPA